MIFKVIAGIVAAALLLVYMAPVVLRLQDTALWVIVMIGVVHGTTPQTSVSCRFFLWNA